MQSLKKLEIINKNAVVAVTDLSITVFKFTVLLTVVISAVTLKGILYLAMICLG